MPAVWKTVRVFISSTFRDMHAERDHLVKVVFPALRERLVKHRINLVDIDLRWGLTREDTINKKTLQLCLDSIHDCRPYFLGILGDLYGSRALGFNPETIQNHPWVSDAVGKSYTELEILYRLVQLQGLANRAFFCFRSPKVYEGIPESHRSRFIEADPQCREIQEALKQRIRKHFPPAQRKCHVYENYPARWDPNASDRPSKSHGRIGGLDVFGKWVLKRLWEAIKAEHNLVDEAAAAVDALAEETDYHERFMESRLRVYVGRQAIQDELQNYADGNDEHACLLTGPSGSGKSAVLARFITTYREQHSHVVVLPHFVGASPRSTGLRDLLRRLCLNLKNQFALADELPEETAKLIVAFRDLVGKIPADRRALIVLDALNQLDETERAQQLEWLPAKLPKHVKVWVSCIRDSGKTEPVLEAFRYRPHRLIEVQPLDDVERRAIIREVPSLSAKVLDKAQIDSLLSNPATANPLFLLVALEELRGFGSYDQLIDRIASFPREGDSVTAVFTQVIERLEEDFHPEAARAILTLLASARRGLAERELLGLLASSKPQLDEGLLASSKPQLDDLFPILRQLRSYLMSRGGLLDFYHRNLFKAVREKHLATDELRAAAHARLAAFFKGQDYFLESLDEQRARAKRLPPTPRPANIRKVDELPWQLLQVAKLAGKDDPKSPHWDSVADLFTDLHFLEAKAEAAG